MQRRTLGADGPSISTLAYGLMSLSSTYGPSEDEESVAAIHRALDLGIVFLDTAEAYGGGHNERLLSRVLQTRRDEALIATKFGLGFEDGRVVANGRPDNVRRAIDGSLKRLGIEHVDLYYLHRRDPDVPIEETVGEMGRLVEAGKVGRLGLSGVSAETLRRGCAEHPIAALQSEYSIFSRDPEDSVLAACEALGVTFVAYSPLGRGLLTGTIRGQDDLADADFRRASPRFAPENLPQNVAIVDALSAMAADKEIEPGQLALAWLLHRGVVPLFGTRRAARVESNARAADVALSDEDLARIEELVPEGAVAGDSLPEAFTSLTER
jgi:aryl-alcohol dehydrogenase-like predicted oxidoreductase